MAVPTKKVLLIAPQRCHGHQLGVNQLSAVPLIPSVRISLAAVSHKFGSTRLSSSRGTKQEVSAMFVLPTYDPAAIAMLGFGILAAAALTFGL
jgi:hypothetical protein